MKLLVNVFFALAIAFSAANLAGAENTNSGPALMTIRFNQKNINYHDQLAYIVSEALKVKSTVVFDVVDVTPANTAGVYGQQVASDIQKLGVPAVQVTTRSESDGVANEEVRIFVR